MLRKLWILGSVASLTMALPTWSAEKSGTTVAPLSGGPVHAIVCHDVPSVPVTADAEQALPYQIVTRLKCGAEVVVLSDSEGYTARVSTADGQSGYVARMYLSAAPINAGRHGPAEATAENGIARWQAGAPGSDTFFTSGALVESLSANGVTVQVSLEDTDWKLRATVAIANNSAQHVHFDPAGFTLDELKPRLRSLAYQNPRNLAKVITHQVYWTNVSAAAPAGEVFGSGAYKTAAFVETPNYMMQDAAQPRVALLARTLAPGEKAAGVVWFERDKNPQQLTLRVFVEDQIFEFPLFFPPHS